MRNRDRSDNVMIFDRDVHMAAKVAALDDPPQVCSLQLTKSKRADWARSYHHEVTQRVQAGVDQTRLAQCELWIQFGMPMWVEDENVGYAHLEVPSAEEASQKAHAEVADEDLLDPEDDDDDAVLPLMIGDLLGSQRTFGRSRLAMQMKMSRRQATRRSRKRPRPRRQQSQSRQQ